MANGKSCIFDYSKLDKAELREYTKVVAQTIGYEVVHEVSSYNKENKAGETSNKTKATRKAKVLENDRHGTKDNTKTFSCHLCSFKSDLMLNLELHLEHPHCVKNEYRCNYCSFSSFIPEVVVNHTRNVHKKWSTVDRKPSQMKHLNKMKTEPIHPGLKRCELCSFTTSAEAELNTHYERNHKLDGTRRKLVDCQECNEQFLTDLGLGKHLVLTHLLISPYMKEKFEKDPQNTTCPFCDMVISDYFEVHAKREHDVEVKYKKLEYSCKTCKKEASTFSSVEKLKRHYKEQHKGKAVKPENKKLKY